MQKYLGRRFRDIKIRGLIFSILLRVDQFAGISTISRKILIDSAKYIPFGYQNLIAIRLEKSYLISIISPDILKAVSKVM